MAKKQDQIYASPLDEMIDFQFDQKVVNVFPDMIQRSVPGYATLISTIGIMAARYVQADSVCYDLGCSLGAVTLSMRRHIQQQDCVIMAVDNSAEMIQQGQKLLDQDKSATPPVTMLCADLQDIVIERASVVVLNFTLQFIPLSQRLTLLQKIYNGLTPGGIIILSEKIAFESEDEQTVQSDLHHDFKRANGYSDLEVAQKRAALENVLIPETLASHEQRLKQVGFSSVHVWFQCFNFISMVAVK